MKISYKSKVLFFILIGITAISGCVTTANKAFDTQESQVQTRSIQTRAFDTTDKKKLLQAVISTMQDLEFVIDNADLVIGSVTGSKFSRGTIVMTVTVRPRGEKQLLVRANVRRNLQPVTDPLTYQDFFTALEKSMFLTAQQVD